MLGREVSTGSNWRDSRNKAGTPVFYFVPDGDQNTSLMMAADTPAMRVPPIHCNNENGCPKHFHYVQFCEVMLDYDLKR